MLRNLPGNPPEWKPSGLLGHDRLLPNCEQVESEATHEVFKANPKENRDDMTLAKWTKGHDGSIIDTSHKMLHGMVEDNFDNVKDPLHWFLHETQKELQDTASDEKECGKEYPVAEEISEKEAQAFQEGKIKRSGQINLNLIGFDDKDDKAIVKSGSKPIESNSFDSPNDSSSNATLEKTSPEVNYVHKEITKHSDVSNDVTDSVTDNEPYEADNKDDNSVEESLEAYEFLPTIYRSLQQKKSPAPHIKIILSPDELRNPLAISKQELLDKLCRQMKMQSQNRRRQHLVSLPLSNRKYCAGSPKNTNNFIPQLGQYGFRSNHVSPVAPASNPYIDQHLFRFPGLNSLQHNPDANRYNFGTPFATLVNTLNQNQEWPTSNLAIGLYGTQKVQGFRSLSPCALDLLSNVYRCPNA